MPILGVNPGERYGFGLAQGQTTLVNVKWNSFDATVLSGLGNKKRFIDSAGFWAHTALILADPLNAGNVLFGPNANAATRVLFPGTEYQIPPVFPLIDKCWTVFDLGDWWFCCPTDPATIHIMYV
jgi:hypothetical protein